MSSFVELFLLELVFPELVFPEEVFPGEVVVIEFPFPLLVFTLSFFAYVQVNEILDINNVQINNLIAFFIIE